MNVGRARTGREEGLCGPRAEEGKEGKGGESSEDSQEGDRVEGTQSEGGNALKKD